MSNPDISIILTFHNEGMVIHKTFLALDRMTKQLDNNNVSYEIIAHIDNGDETTTNYIKSIEKSHKLRVFYNSFGEPAQSRNFSIEQANGKYVCLMDGDDLFSENWLIDAYRLQESYDEDVILHPEYNITFGLDEQPRFWRMKDSYDLETAGVLEHFLKKTSLCASLIKKLSVVMVLKIGNTTVKLAQAALNIILFLAVFSFIAFAKDRPTQNISTAIRPLPTLAPSN